MNFSQKTGKQKIVFILGIGIFAMYLALGLVFIFMKNIPFNLSPVLRVGFGIVLVAYAVFRLYRLTKQE